MKTTMTSRNMANPRRTTLAHLKDAAQVQAVTAQEYAVELPAMTANPRRTILMKAPVVIVAE
ncbi:hypothetical protein [Streptomyces sp. NPDC097619]|uniref:hypothetical protein n=1 Tax=Streptomyces sp. NPDC097619 TaxID=3157228 RepID=UPI003317241F